MEAQQALAFAAKREGARSMPAPRWAHVLSLELRWMTPAQAKAYVARAKEAGLLAGEEDLSLTFDPKHVEVPRDFRPDPTAAMAAPDAFLVWVDRVAKATGRGRDQVLDEVQAVQTEMGGYVTADLAVLRLAARAGLDVRTAAMEAGERLTTRSAR